MKDILGEHRTTLAWLRAGLPAPSEVEARLNRIEDALWKLEAAPALARQPAGAGPARPPAATHTRR